MVRLDVFYLVNIDLNNKTNKFSHSIGSKDGRLLEGWALIRGGRLSVNPMSRMSTYSSWGAYTREALNWGITAYQIVYFLIQNCYATYLGRSNERVTRVSKDENDSWLVYQVLVLSNLRSTIDWYHQGALNKEWRNELISAFNDKFKCRSNFTGSALFD